MKTTMKTYKGFDKNLKCRGFQYEEGKEYETKGAIKACENGFHACERPLDVFNYYAPAQSVYHEVEQSGELSREASDTKVASSKIKIGARLDIRGLVKAQIDYVKEHTTTEYTDPERATAGNYGAATAGECGAATAGYKGAATAGECGAATAGECGAATAGEWGAATAGNYGAATAGECGAATSRGRAAVGENGIACARTTNPKAKGGLGAVIVLVAENEHGYDIANWKAFVIDGKKYLPDTWYKLDEDGNVVKVEE